MNRTNYRHTLADGHVIEVYEPPGSNVEPMRRGRCPGCGEQLHGFVGRHAAIRELDADGRVVGSAHATSFGHLMCVFGLFNKLVDYLTAPDEVPHDLAWTRGTQREMIDFVQRYEGAIVEVCFDKTRGRTQRYNFRVKE